MCVCVCVGDDVVVSLVRPPLNEGGGREEGR